MTIEHFNREFYLGNDKKSSDELQLESMARANAGVAWNREIGKYIIDALHVRLLDTPSGTLIGLCDILVLISNGWLYTARQIVAVTEIPPELTETKEWLMAALEQADDT